MRLLQTCKRQRGFTLLEVLMAVGIFSIIGVGAYHVLQLVITSAATTAVHSEALSRLQRAMLLIGNDLEQVVDRPVRDVREEWSNALISDHDGYLLEFTRQGWRNPLQLPRSNLQRVAYALQSYPDPDSPGRFSASLLRYYRQVPAHASTSQPKGLVLLDNVLDTRFRFLDRRGVWHAAWPADVGDALPLAVEIGIETGDAGMVKRVFQTGDLYETGQE